MPIMPLNADSNSWLICFSYKLDGKDKFIKEEFVGSIREAMFHEMQLRDLARAGVDLVVKHT